MPFPSFEALQAVRQASKRAAAGVHGEMKQGLTALATIASVAPFVGFFGTVFGIVNSFRGVDGSKSWIMAAVTELLSESIWPTALGLLVGLISLWFYKYLSGRLETLDREMDNASLELVNQLSRCRARFAPVPAADNRSPEPMFGERPLAELHQDQKSLRRSRVIAGVALIVAWGAQLPHYYSDYSDYPLQLHSVGLSALLHVLFTFGISCLAAYPIWTKLLHRKPGGLAALGALLCLCLNVAEIVSCADH
jgi:hypothetical protein